MAQRYSNSLYPPDNSGTWYDDGWGGWVQDIAAVGQVPADYEEDGWGVLIPKQSNPTLEPKTANDIRKTIEQAKAEGKTAVGRVLADILDFGTPYLRKFIDGWIVNKTAPISLQNIDVNGLLKAIEKGELSNTKVIEVPKTPTPPTNSTFLGIDFSNGLNIALLLLGLFGLWKLISSGSEPKEQKEQNRGSQNFIPRPQRRSVNV